PRGLASGGLVLGRQIRPGLCEPLRIEGKTTSQPASAGHRAGHGEDVPEREVDVSVSVFVIVPAPVVANCARGLASRRTSHSYGVCRPTAARASFSTSPATSGSLRLGPARVSNVSKLVSV